MLPLQCRNPTYNRVSSFSCSNSLLEYFHRYGGRAITEQCPAAMLLMCVQSIVGVIIQVQASRIRLSENVSRLAWQALYLPSSWCPWVGVRPSFSPRLSPFPQFLQKHKYMPSENYFPQNALITMRNGALYLLVRIADLRMKHLIECHVNGHFLMKVNLFSF